MLIVVASNDPKTIFAEAITERKKEQKEKGSLLCVSRGAIISERDSQHWYAVFININPSSAYVSIAIGYIKDIVLSN